MSQASSKIPQQQGSSALQPSAGAGGQSAPPQVQIPQTQERAYNPLSQAGSGNVSGALNADVARMRKGPSEV